MYLAIRSDDPNDFVYICFQFVKRKVYSAVPNSTNWIIKEIKISCKYRDTALIILSPRFRFLKNESSRRCKRGEI